MAEGIWAGVGDGATPSRVAEPTPAQGAGSPGGLEAKRQREEWEGALMLGTGGAPLTCIIIHLTHLSPAGVSYSFTLTPFYV